MKCIHCAVKYFLCLLKHNYKALKLIIVETFCFAVKIAMFVKIIFDRVK